MIMHASFKHFLRYVRKMCILLNPWVNTREYMCTSTTKTGHTVSHKGFGKTGAFSLIWEEVSTIADPFPNERKCPCFLRNKKYIHKKYIHRAPSTALCIVLSHSKALMSPVLLEVKTSTSPGRPHKPAIHSLKVTEGHTDTHRAPNTALCVSLSHWQAQRHRHLPR